MKTNFILVPILFLGFILVGCAQEAVAESPEPVVEVVAEIPADEVVVPEEEVVVEEEAVEELPAEEAPAARAEAEEPTIAVVIPQNEYRDIEQEPSDAIHADSSAYAYMIRPDDYLGKIAYDQYGNANEWRSIYRWNREAIGDDPNMIYPYNELELFKPTGEVDGLDLSYDFRMHVVMQGETLWSIGGSEYGDAKAWIVIFWDNEATLEANKGMLTIGMELKIRTRLLN